MTNNTQAHWDHIYETKAGNELSWFQEHPAISLDLIRATGAKPGTAIIDIGGGASRLVDALLDERFHALTVLDLSESALAAAKARLGPRSAKVAWITADVTAWEPSETYDLWHDRAAFDFLTEAAGRLAYAERVTRAVRPGGYVIIGTFAPDGPERCSGLPVLRHNAASGAVLGEGFALVHSRRHDHVTPAGRTQGSSSVFSGANNEPHCRSRCIRRFPFQRIRDRGLAAPRAYSPEAVECSRMRHRNP
jgi:SAM-dependent methyltransferase